MSDGIEMHFDEKRGCLELACEPDAFAPYREIAREQLVDFPEIPIDQIIEINIVDSVEYVARRGEPDRRIGAYALAALLIAVVSLAAVGLVSVASWLAT